ncbi:TetR/AcrR family transcriptional regulator [Amylibacter sp. SFDW26]|uniref:TetR/AcrR family transcriptional regulator n=1 Tax=Amylibacter sp. SFDW26 TaxID=2652722 RepID=UPI00186A2709|nr:TetR/AcrR family transcriptional regulator [Amylibacter sp. SFDW26]
MARPKTGDKPNDIRNATVREVAAIGSTAVSVNKIAKRAGLSVGTIYRYHKTKDDLLFWVFLQLKRDIHKTMMDAAGDLQGASLRLRAMWFALIEYGFNAPQDFLLVEMMSAETRPSFLENSELQAIQNEVLGEIQAGIDQRVLVNVPTATIETILASPAITLARRASLSGIQIEKEELDRIYNLIWRGIAQDH